VERAAALALLARLHAAQGAFYAGEEGAEAALRALLDPAIEWRVPGRDAIAGDYRGLDEVMSYFARRRDHAARTFRMHPVLGACFSPSSRAQLVIRAHAHLLPAQRFASFCAVVVHIRRPTTLFAPEVTRSDKP